MAVGDIQVTFVGNLTSDPELRFTPSGAAVANFTVACTPRTLDKNTNEWKDGETTFLRCQVWRQYAENVAESLTRGARVIVTGRLKQRSYETKEGEKRTSIEVDVEDIGPALRNATCKITKSAGATSSRSDSGASDASDPWATSTGGAWAGQTTDEPPF
jgi:single-strand DNA-binding protein